ncbi:MAG: DNA cytosine methyltransferase [Eubacteriales bacterium]|nr:DNA cytosine methyltransferase [Eubacteriales bacterium]
MYRSVDLFAGIGGIRLGFDIAFKDLIKTVFVSEWDLKAQETYRANFQDPVEIHGDITKIHAREIPDHDILLAGFPCQAFSLAGHKRGFDDARGTLFFDVARIAEYHKPKVVFCENVKNFVNHDKGRTFKIIKTILNDLGYVVFSKVLNSNDFGVPQNRERIYIVAFREDIAPVSFDFPVGTSSGSRISDILEENEVSSKYYLSERYLNSLRAHRRRHESKGNGFGYEIRENDGIAGAIVCGGMGRERNLVIDKRLTDFTPVTNKSGPLNNEFVRTMTPREWARLQGFPDSFKLVVADTHLYKQLGNSVTVPVIEAIAEHVKAILEGSVIEKPLELARGEQMNLFGDIYVNG